MTTGGRPETSVWLVPAEPHRAELRGRIDALAQRVGTPSFDPHVTLASAAVDGGAVRDAIERVAARWAPLEVAAGATAHGPERFRCVYVELADRRLWDLASALHGELGLPFTAGELRPHVSLLYAEDLPLAVRAELAAEHGLEGHTIRFDTLAASVPGTDVDDVARWQLPVVRPLAGEAPRRPG